jgi:hypothetical protein
VTGSPDSTVAERRSGSLALSALGLALILLGAAWWALDADPARGKALLLVGAVLAVAGRMLGGRLSPMGQRILLVVVVGLALLTLAEGAHLVQVVNDQRASHLD